MAGCGARLDLATDDRNHDRAQMLSFIIIWWGGKCITGGDLLVLFTALILGPPLSALILV